MFLLNDAAAQYMPNFGICWMLLIPNWPLLSSSGQMLRENEAQTYCRENETQNLKTQRDAAATKDKVKTLKCRGSGGSRGFFKVLS